MRESWEIKRIGDVCEVLDSKRKPITKSNRQSGSIPYYGATGIQDYVKDYIFDGRYLLIGEDGAKWGKDDNTAFIIEGKSWVNNHAHILQLHSNVIDSFVRYYLNGKDLNSFITGAVVPKLTQAALVSIPIPVPPLQEQERIVAELDLLTGIIDKQKQQLKELDTLAQSIFYDMFGNPVENDRGWDVRTLEDLADVGSSRRIFAKEYTDKGIPFYRIKEVVERSRKQALSVELFISKERYSEIKSKNGIPSVGDILITAVGTIGEIWVVDSEEPFYFKDGNIIWLHSISNDVNSSFFRYQLEALIEDYKKVSIGSAYSALTIVKLKQLLCPIPPRDIQDLFSEKIASIEKQKQSINRSLAESQKLFDYTMDKYFG